MLIKRRQSSNEDVFEASVLSFSIVSFKRIYDEYLFVVFLYYLLKFKLLDEFFLFQSVIANLSLCVARVYVFMYIHWIKTSLELSLALFVSAIFKVWQDGSLFSFLFYLCWSLNRLKFDGQCLFLSYCNSCFACERSFLTGAECPGECAHCTYSLGQLERPYNAISDKNKT